MVAAYLFESMTDEASKTHTDVIVKCAMIRHDLGSVLSRIDANAIVSWHKDVSVEARSGKDVIEGLFSTLDECVVNLNSVIDNLVDSYSPIHLVNSGPLVEGLNEATLTIIRNALHHAYLEQTKIEEIKEKIEHCADVFKADLGEFNRMWRQQPPCDSELIEVSLNKTMGSGKDLYDALCRLPKEVVLP